VSEFSHFRINHSTHFAERQNHIRVPAKLKPQVPY